MIFSNNTLNQRFRAWFRPRDLFLHNGSELRRVHLSTKVQAGVASLSGLAAFGLVLTAGQLTAGIAMATTTVAGMSRQHDAVSQMQDKVATLQLEVEQIRQGAKLHAAKLDQRDALLAAVLSGHGDPSKLAALAALDVPLPASKLAKEVRLPLSAAEAKQAALAAQVRLAFDAQYSKAQATINQLGLGSGRLHQVAGATGGPYEPVNAYATTASASAVGDHNFHALFQSWKKLDQLQHGIVGIPSIRPVDSLTFTSNFGVRNDPFRGTRAFHAGVDIPGAHGTNIYATADGVVNRAGWTGGYGNLVELDHGRGIMTRYGHLSSFVVSPGQHIHRGDLIAHMGSTGRSTGTHLHYEVRIDGAAVNPVPFLQSTDYLMALQNNSAHAKVAMGGPEETAD